ncbi:hypothetical protein HY640_03395 [Candidatus Woesearchaeota archaeon]|nr:hypothetical protein [Candidatus Woesearchaeota archaeon]
MGVRAVLLVAGVLFFSLSMVFLFFSRDRIGISDEVVVVQDVEPSEVVSVSDSVSAASVESAPAQSQAPVEGRKPVIGSGGLVIRNVNITPSSPLVNSFVNVSVAIYNSGTSKVTSTLIVLLGNGNKLSKDFSLVPGETEVISFVDLYTSSGTYTVKAELSGFEFDASKGVFVKTLTVRPPPEVQGDRKPDLKVTEISFEVGSLSGGRRHVVFYVNVRNFGGAKSGAFVTGMSGPGKARFRLISSGLEPGQVAKFRLGTYLYPGDYSVAVAADSDGVVSEIDEENNAASKVVSV